MIEESSGFDEFVIARTAGLLRFAYLMTADTALSQDLVQEALIKVYKRWSTVRSVDRPDAYVRRMLVNQYVSWRRRLLNREVPTALIPDLVPMDSAESIFTERDLVWRALQRLTRRQRSVLVLRYYEDLADEEIAKILGCATSTVRSLASRALQSLRADLDTTGTATLPNRRGE